MKYLKFAVSESIFFFFFFVCIYFRNISHSLLNIYTFVYVLRFYGSKTKLSSFSEIINHHGEPGEGQREFFILTTEATTGPW